MNLMTKAVLLVATLALAACNNPRGGDYQDPLAGGGAGGISSTALGDPNDPPRSPISTKRLAIRCISPWIPAI